MWNFISPFVLVYETARRYEVPEELPHFFVDDGWCWMEFDGGELLSVEYYVDAPGIIFSLTELYAPQAV